MAVVEATETLTVAAAEFDPLVLRLAQLVGILSASDDDGNCVVDTDWFRDPLTSLKQIPTERAAQVVGVLQALVGAASGSALGAPQKELGRLWYPLPFPGATSAADTPFFIVGPEGQTGADVVLGLGVRHAFSVDGITLNAFAYLPMIEFGSDVDPPRFALGEETQPIQLGFELKGVAFSSGQVSFDGLQLALDIYLAKKAPQIDLVFLNLSLPGYPAADRSLLDIAAYGPSEWIASGISVVAGQLLASVEPAERPTVEAMVDDVLALLGLTPGLPAIDWAALVADPAKAGTLLLDWLGGIAGSAPTLQRWLEVLVSLVEGKEAPADTPDVTGSGTRADPFAVQLLSLSGITVSLTAATEADPVSGTDLYPGLRVAAAPSVLPQSLPVSVVASAVVEIACIPIPKPGATQLEATPLAGLLFPTFDAGVTLANTDPTKPLFAVADTSPLGAVGTFSIGSARASIGYAAAVGKPQPSFELVAVQTAAVTWPTVDLLNFDEIVGDAKQAVTGLVGEEIEKFLGLGTAAAAIGDVAAALAGLLGIQPPPSFTPAQWTPTPLVLDPSELQPLITSPLGTLGSYWARTMQTPLKTGGPAFPQLLPCLAGVFGGDPRGAVTGSGTRVDPWRATVLAAGQAGALTVSGWTPSPTSADMQELHLGISFVFDLTVAGVVLELSLGADLLDLDLSATGAGTPGASFLANATAEVLVRNAATEHATAAPLAPPTVGGAGVSVSDIALSCGWDRQQGVFGAVEIDGVELVAGGLTVQVGDLDFVFTGTSWDEATLTKLGGAVVNFLGLWLVENGGRLGVAATTLLGLLPDSAAIYTATNPPYPVPTGFTLPGSWPAFTLSTIADPFPPLRTQLGALVGSGEIADAALQLLGWALTGALPGAPEKAPAGTIDDPFTVTLTSLHGLQPLVWRDTTAEGALSAVGFGIQCATSVQQASASLQAAVLARVNLYRVAIPGGGTPAAPVALPRASLLLSCTNPAGGPIVSAGGAQIGSAELGGSYGPDGAAVVATLLDATVGGGVPPATIDLAAALSSSDTMQTLAQLLRDLLQTLTPHLGATSANGVKPALDATIDLLDALGLVTTLAGWKVIDPIAWLALLAKPSHYVEQRIDEIYADDARATAFATDLAALLGRESLTPPGPLAAVPVVLEAFGLARGTAAGALPRPSAWIELGEHPIAFTEQRGRALFADAAQVQALVSELAKLNLAASPLPGGLTLTIDNGTRVTLALPSKPGLAIGSELVAAGSLALDLKAQSVTADGTVWSRRAGAGAGAAVTLTTTAAQWEVDLRAAPTATVAALPPLVLAGSTPPDLVQELLSTAPAFVLSTIAPALINGYVLPASPLAGRVLQALGLLTPPQGDELARVSSVLGALTHPLDWILSPGVLGDGSGNLDVAKLGTQLATIAGSGVSGPGGIKLEAAGATGLTLTGLPYGGTFTLSAAGGQLTLQAEVKDTVDGIAVDLKPGLVYDLRTGVAASGTIATTIPITSSATLVVNAGYGASGFTLAFATQQGTSWFPGKDDPLPLVPFPGLGKFLTASGEMLLALLATKALAAYHALTPPPAGLSALYDGLKAAAAAVGITTVGDKDTTNGLIYAVDKFANDPATWLSEKLATANLEPVLTELQSLLDKTLGIEGVTLDPSGLFVTWSPTLSTGSVALLFGQRTVGSDQVLGVWVEPAIAASPIVIALTAGAGLRMPISPSAPALELTLDASVGIADGLMPVPPMKGPPTLRASVDAAPLTGELSFSASLYPAGDDGTKDTPLVALLPQAHLALGDAPGTAVPLTDWLTPFLAGFAIPVIGDAVLSTSAVVQWLTAPIGDPSTPASMAAILEQLKLIRQVSPGPPPTFAPLDPRVAFAGMDWEQIALQLAGVALEVVAEAPPGRKLVAVANGGVYLVAEPSGTSTLYAFDLQIPDVTLTSDPATTPQVVLQLGKWPSLDDPAHPWITKSNPNAPAAADPGIVAQLVQKDSAGVFTFVPGLDLVSVGVDVLGSDKNPLVSAGGFELAEVESRVYLSLADDGGKLEVDYGLLAQCDGIGVPLGRKLGTVGGNNPIADNLLSSAESNGGAPGKSVNPTFTASTYWVEGGQFELELHGDPALGDTPNQIWLPVQRALGPLYCRKVGIGWKQSAFLLELGFDGSISLAGLTVDLEDLDVGIPVKTPLELSAYTIDLAGLDVNFQGGPVQINGGLLRSETGGVVSYDGMVVIHASSFGVTALGGYAQIPVTVGGDTKYQPSIFVFALLQMSIGGPPEFYVTGAAAGFGYNRNLILPGQDGVGTFPLVAGVTNPSGTFPDPSDLDAAFRKLEQYIPPAVGEYWLAAGVEFGSFELLTTFGLLAVSFGTEFTVALLGVSTLAVPNSPAVSEAPPIAKATLQMEAIFRPSAGYLSATATLTSDSFVLDPAARLTGGFALEIWFGGEHSGDFVVTLGGYHPAFKPPSYYPQEPRLGINWPLGPVQVTGGCYFALTPSAAMAGGYLSITFEAGNLKAWFDAGADFLVVWKPFYFNAWIGVSIGASYRLDALFIHHTFTIELGASLNLWGPPVGGVVEIDWYIISFTVDFGPDNAGSTHVKDWPAFDASFLPQQKSAQALSQAQPPTDAKVLAQAASGLMSNVGDDPTQWVINPQRFRIVTASVIPSSAVTYNGAAVTTLGVTPAAVGVRPLGASSLASSHDIELDKHEDGGGTTRYPATYLSFKGLLKNVPQALWSTTDAVGPDGPTLVEGALAGVEITPSAMPLNATDPFPVANFNGNTSDITVNWLAQSPPTKPTYDQTSTVPPLMASLQSDTVSEARRALLAALAQTSPQLDRAGALPVLGTFAEQILQAPESLVTLGGQLALAGSEVDA